MINIMTRSFYIWSTIFALTTLIVVVGLINSNTTITGNVSAVTGAPIFSSDEMYSISWILVVSFFLISAYMAFFYKKKKLDLSPENVEKTLDEGLVRIKKKVRKYL